MEQVKFKVFEREMIHPLHGVQLTRNEEFVAGLLLQADAEHTYTIKDIIRCSEQVLARPLTMRTVQGTVRRLRKLHKFPILSTKNPPFGYWWCGSVEEMKNFVEEWRRQAMDELHTLSQMVRHNFPALAGQLRLPEMEEDDACGNSQIETQQAACGDPYRLGGSAA